MRTDAKTKIRKRAQNAICSHSSERNAQFSGAMRERPSALSVSPAPNTATTPETWNSRSLTMNAKYKHKNDEDTAAASVP